MLRLVAIAIGYAFGLIQTAYIIGKMHGIDIRDHGSGNAGTTNALRVLGTKIGLLVFAGDALKCVIAVCITHFIANQYAPDLKYLLMMYAAFGCVIAHDFPFYLHFRGGKGIAATAGMVFSYHYLLFPIGLVAFFVPFLLTHYVSLGSLILYAVIFISVILFGECGLLGQMAVQTRIELYAILLVLTILAYWQHRANIGRLLRHEERKTYVFKKNDEKKKED